MDRDADHVLVNCWYKSRRLRWWNEQPTDHMPNVPANDTSDSTVLRLSLGRALGRLSEEHRAVLVLRYVANMSVRPVA